MLSPNYALVSASQTETARDVFFNLFHGQASEIEEQQAAKYLRARLAEVDDRDPDLPSSRGDLERWMHDGVERVGRQYREYLKERSAGGPRQYFRGKSHALYFLKCAAPTKLVDGAWLFGLLNRWHDPRFTSLIQTYLEELGDGLPDKNHVLIYRKLLTNLGCDRWDDLSDAHFVQGAIQLTMAHHAEQFLPEIIGYNLGYEQLPLHLLITAYELKELGIDPYYFTLHVTVDNADNGHARKAVDAVFDTMPRLGDADDWLRRVRNGYLLNDLGANTASIIRSFDLERELLAIFRRKSFVGQHAHSDYHRIGGRTVNDWLADSNQPAEFLAAMQREGWFNRHENPQNSRFWKMIQSDRAKMFGVFSSYEQRILHDWIAGDAVDEFPYSAPKRTVAKPPVRPASGGCPFATGSRISREQSPEDSMGDFDAELRELESRLELARDRREMLETLISLMSPADHHTPAGLLATRTFIDMMKTRTGTSLTAGCERTAQSEVPFV